MPSEKAGVDPRIDDVIMRTLCREPAERYQHVSDVENELQSISETPAQIGWNGASQRPTGREWKSNATIFGWPIVHVAYGNHPRTGEKLVAKGLIAVGDTAIGGLAVGGFSIGIVSIGGLGAGILTMGGLAFGLQAALGGVAIGGYAMGGLAIGLIAVGGAANGALAMGGSANGYIAAGGDANGRYVLEEIGKWNPPDFANSLIGTALADSKLPLFAFVMMLMLTVGPPLLIAALALVGTIRSRARGVIEQAMPGSVTRNLIGAIIWTAVLVILLPVMATVQATVVNRLVTPVGGQQIVVEAADV
jgi:hypothetical protein